MTGERHGVETRTQWTGGTFRDSERRREEGPMRRVVLGNSNSALSGVTGKEGMQGFRGRWSGPPTGDELGPHTGLESKGKRA